MTSKTLTRLKNKNNTNRSGESRVQNRQCLPLVCYSDKDFLVGTEGQAKKRNERAK